MKQIKNITAAEILKQIKLTVICGEEITETNVCDGFSTWMQQFDASNPYEAFTPESREYFQNKLFVAFAAGMLPAEVTETRTNEVGPDGCWVFTVETAGTLNPYEETEEETEETETETAAPSAPSANEETAAEEQTTDTEEEEEENTVEKIKVVYEKKEGRTYTETWRSENPEEVYERLAHCLIAKKLNNCGWIRSIKRVPLYNGFDRITVTHDNGGRDVYTVASN